MQNYKFAMEYLKTIVGIVVVGLVIWSRISEQRAKQRRQAAAQRQKASAQWSAVAEEEELQQESIYEPLSHDNFRPVSIPEVPEEGERTTEDVPPVPTKAQEEESSVDVERWRRALIDSEILKTKF